MKPTYRPGVIVRDVNGPEYRTPLTDLPDRRVGRVRLRHTSLSRGYYPAEGTDGADYLRITHGRLRTTELQSKRPSSPSAERGGWWTWMTDDWLHWNAMRERVLALPAGTRSVVCAGLGLGLMLHHFQERPDIEDIRVVELDPEVVDLILPTVPPDPRVSVAVADYYRYIEVYPAPDAVLWDLAVGDPAETRGSIHRGIALTAIHWPDAVLSVFGLRLQKRSGETEQKGTQP